MWHVSSYARIRGIQTPSPPQVRNAVEGCVETHSTMVEAGSDKARGGGTLLSLLGPPAGSAAISDSDGDEDYSDMPPLVSAAGIPVDTPSDDEAPEAHAPVAGGGGATGATPPALCGWTAWLVTAATAIACGIRRSAAASATAASAPTSASAGAVESPPPPPVACSRCL